MYRALPIIALFLATMATMAPAQSLEQLQKSFIENYDALNTERNQKLKKLSTGYLGALERMLDQVKATGSLDAVLPVRDEITAIQKDTWPLKELPKTSPRKLPELRGKYVEARGKIVGKHAGELVAMAAKMQQLLKDKEIELTKAGEIDSALAAKRMRETLDEDPGLATAKELTEAAAPDSQRRGWSSLLDEKLKKAEVGNWHVGVLSEIPEDAKVYGPMVARYRQEPDKPNEILMSPPPAKLEFQLSEPATKMKGELLMANSLGDAVFKIKTGNKVVFEKRIQGRSERASFDIEFDSTKKITLEVDPLDIPSHDWCAWIKPEIR